MNAQIHLLYARQSVVGADEDPTLVQKSFRLSEGHEVDCQRMKRDHVLQSVVHNFRSTDAFLGQTDRTQIYDKVCTISISSYRAVFCYFSCLVWARAIRSDTLVPQAYLQDPRCTRQFNDPAHDCSWYSNPVAGQSSEPGTGAAISDTGLLDRDVLTPSCNTNR